MNVNDNNSIQNVYTFDVGGKLFKFSKETLLASGKNLLTGVLDKRYKKGEQFIDADPKIFRKWIAPYIRDKILPDIKSIKDAQGENRIVAVANRVGIVAIVNHIKNSKKPEKNIIKRYGGSVRKQPP